MLKLSILAEEQAGFRSGRTTVEQVVALRQLFQHRLKKQNGKLSVYFIDYMKAFDKVWHEALFALLDQFGINIKVKDL